MVGEAHCSLDAVFAIDIFSYAVMNNHFHLVARIDQDQAQSCSDSEGVFRWLPQFSDDRLVNHFVKGESALDCE